MLQKLLFFKGTGSPLYNNDIADVLAGNALKFHQPETLRLNVPFFGRQVLFQCPFNQFNQLVLLKRLLKISGYSVRNEKIFHVLSFFGRHDNDGQ